MGLKTVAVEHNGINWMKMEDEHGRMSLTCDTHGAHVSFDGYGKYITVYRRGQDGRPGREIGKVPKFSDAIDLIIEDKKSPE